MNENISNYIKVQLNEFPLTINRNLSSLVCVKFNKRDDFDILKKRIDYFINKKSEERFFILHGLRVLEKPHCFFSVMNIFFKQKDIEIGDILYISCDAVNSLGEINIRELVEKYLEDVHNTTPGLLDKPVFLLFDEVHYDKNWALNAKILYDKSPYIFMIFAGSSITP